MSDQYELKDKKGFLFRNKNKNNTKQPEFTGKIKIDGKEYKLSAWENKNNNSNDYYFSISVSEPGQFNKPKEESANSTQERREEPNSYKQTQSAKSVQSNDELTADEKAAYDNIKSYDEGGDGDAFSELENLFNDDE